MPLPFTRSSPSFPAVPASSSLEVSPFYSRCSPLPSQKFPFLPCSSHLPPKIKRNQKIQPSDLKQKLYTINQKLKVKIEALSPNHDSGQKYVYTALLVNHHDSGWSCWPNCIKPEAKSRCCWHGISQLLYILGLVRGVSDRRPCFVWVLCARVVYFMWKKNITV